MYQAAEGRGLLVRWFVRLFQLQTRELFSASEFRGHLDESKT